MEISVLLWGGTYASRHIKKNLQVLTYDMNTISFNLSMNFWTSHWAYESVVIWNGRVRLCSRCQNVESKLARCLTPALSCINSNPSTLILRNSGMIYLFYLYNYHRKIILLHLGSVSVLFFLKVTKAMLSWFCV